MVGEWFVMRMTRVLVGLVGVDTESVCVFVSCGRVRRWWVVSGNRDNYVVLSKRDTKL